MRTQDAYSRVSLTVGDLDIPHSIAGNTAQSTTPLSDAAEHEVAKLLLEHAGTFVGRTGAIEFARQLGMTFQEIEAYLDWLDFVRQSTGDSDETY